jgi:mannose-6-phosphate isomerase-like protein (cupin superfamily)
MTKVETNKEFSATSGTQTSPAKPVGSSGHGKTREWLQGVPGGRAWIAIPAMDTDGAYSVVEIVSNPGESTPMHVHQNEDEHFVIVEGTARFAYGDEIFDAPAGTSITLSRKIPHAWGNASGLPLRMVAICTPGGAEEVFRVIGQGGTDVDITSLANKYNVQVVGPLLLSDGPALPRG